ncbi:MAG: DUF1499 domain-containing protein [Chthoniobacterales bacterium]
MLKPCPSSPNCVSTDADDARHVVAALQLRQIDEQTWSIIRAAVSCLPRTKLITERDQYLHAECRSALAGFVDDLELELRPADAVLAARSASRLGYYDFGVNRRRIEALRDLLRDRGLLA